ncbi:YqeG family HAD IIIA-type phosphatase [Candidatus Woesearchaeota archaeon]|nr:YqeG family HAD IIIA-type phosphatase [Candidatus Woesearchaeota archaeon]
MEGAEYLKERLEYSKLLFTNSKPWQMARPLFSENLTPDMSVDSINDLSVEELEKLGIKGLFFDFDNTLGLHGGVDIDEGVDEKLRELVSEFPSLILSNALPLRQIKMQSRLENEYGLRVLVTDYQKKPSKKVFDFAMGEINMKPKNVAVIGDRLLTDVAGGNIAGTYTIKVKPLSMKSEPNHITLMRGVEYFLRHG